jgi:hypothetical protein
MRMMRIVSNPDLEGDRFKYGVNRFSTPTRRVVQMLVPSLGSRLQLQGSVARKEISSKLSFKVNSHSGWWKVLQ